MRALLSIQGLEKTFGHVVAARDINVDVPQGQTIGIIGANGAGKTTFVNMITGHLAPSGGIIQFEGLDIAPSRWRRSSRPSACSRTCARRPPSPVPEAP
jgi:branched-chain amino acid transport system ATP-binding protein